MIADALFSSASQTWNTPACVLERVRQVGAIELDPCSNEHSIVGANIDYRLERGDDGLALGWYSLTYCNPPYSDLEAWAAKMAREAASGVEIIACIPARTDTAAFQRHILPTCSAICFWRGRIKFGIGPMDNTRQVSLWEMGQTSRGSLSGDPAPFPSCLPYWGTRVKRFAAAFGDAGRIVVTR